MHAFGVQGRSHIACAKLMMLVFAGCDASVAGARSPEAQFLAENEAAMEVMHHEMRVAPTGDVDRDFATMMIPHHQGAIDMARALLRYGTDLQMRRLAQEIIVEQQQEIAIMSQFLNQPQGPAQGGQ